jgi:hypothetical protein
VNDQLLAQQSIFSHQFALTAGQIIGCSHCQSFITRFGLRFEPVIEMFNTAFTIWMRISYNREETFGHEDKMPLTSPPAWWIFVCIQAQAAGKGANQPFSGKGKSRISATNHRRFVSPAAMAGVR